MEPLPALFLASASYAGSLLVWRRVRLVRHGVPPDELAQFRTFDHLELVSQLVPSGLVSALPGGVEAPALHPPGARKELLRTAARTEALEFLRAGAWDSAAAVVCTEGRAAGREFLAGLSAERTLAGDLEGARTVAALLAKTLPQEALLAARLAAFAWARGAEAAPRGTIRDLRCAEAVRQLRAAGALAADAPPALGALLAHVIILGLGHWNLELSELRARRVLSRVAARSPTAAELHLERAHLAAALGEAENATVHLARALYYARGAPFYARLVLSCPSLTQRRPALLREAKAALEEHAEQGRQV